jgi:hypothetical protein
VEGLLFHWVRIFVIYRGLYFGGGRHNRLCYSIYETVFKDESIVVVAMGEPGVPLICWALTVMAASRKKQGGRGQFEQTSILGGIHPEHSCGSQFPWSVLRPKNLGFRYIPLWSRKHALSGIVGCGKTTMLRRIQEALSQDKEILTSKSLSLEKSQISLATLIMALFYDLATEKDFKIPTQPERQERALRDLIKKRQKPIALFIDDAHDLHSKTLIGLKRLIEVVRCLACRSNPNLITSGLDFSSPSIVWLSIFLSITAESVAAGVAACRLMSSRYI